MGERDRLSIEHIMCVEVGGSWVRGRWIVTVMEEFSSVGLTWDPWEISRVRIGGFKTLERLFSVIAG